MAQRTPIFHHARARSDGVPNFMKGSPNHNEIGDPGSPISWGPQNFMTPEARSPSHLVTPTLDGHKGGETNFFSVSGTDGDGHNGTNGVQSLQNFLHSLLCVYQRSLIVIIISIFNNFLVLYFASCKYLFLCVHYLTLWYSNPTLPSKLLAMCTARNAAVISSSIPSSSSALSGEVK